MALNLLQERFHLLLQNKIRPSEKLFRKYKFKKRLGHANDYIKAMWLMLQNKSPKDYVVGTGETYSVKEFVKIAFEHVNLNYKDYLKIDKELFDQLKWIYLKLISLKLKKN